MSFDLRRHTQLLCIAGSRAYGLHTPESDVDLKGAAVPPRAILHGFVHRWEQSDSPEEIAPMTALLKPEEREVARRTKVEGSIYDLRKLAALAADGNPNILELFWCRDEEVRLATEVGERLREAAPLFLSQRVRHSFAGYATSQLKRIRGHRRWLLEPPTRPPTRADFGLPPSPLAPNDQLLAAEAGIRMQMDRWEVDWGQMPPAEVLRLQGEVSRMLAEQGVTAERNWHGAARAIGLDDNLIDVLDRERRFRNAVTEWKQYEAWKRQRNPDRAALEARHGYDTKHGMHLLRLLRMGREILLEGRMHVWREDHEELLAVRAGAWTYDALVDEAERLDQELERIVKERRAVVPPRPDLGVLDELVVRCIDDVLSAL